MKKSTPVLILLAMLSLMGACGTSQDNESSTSSVPVNRNYRIVDPTNQYCWDNRKIGFITLEKCVNDYSNFSHYQIIPGLVVGFNGTSGYGQIRAVSDNSCLTNPRTSSTDRRSLTIEPCLPRTAPKAQLDRQTFYMNLNSSNQTFFANYIAYTLGFPNPQAACIIFGNLGTGSGPRVDLFPCSGVAYNRILPI